ncbi:MAG: xanthine dehydrogenase family protein subunit M, partial [Chloroflexia bacterium]|nr:xanthine dehydrogenase family protein subunit M [Chloroflexia bacterium]
MHPYPFTYHRPASIEDALSLLGQFGDSGKLLAGGHSLLPVMKLRLAQPEHLIDITGLSDLAGVSLEGNVVSIGALTTHHQLATDAILATSAALLAEIAHVVGDQQVRNRGTLGGALAHADPAADYPAGVLALDAEIVARGPNGERTIPIDEFFVGFLTTALEPDEILTSIRVPTLAANTGYRYEKLQNPASGYAIVGVAAVVTVDADGKVSAARLGITGAGDMAYRPQAVENALVGTIPTVDSVKAAAESAVDGVELLSDIHAPADYRARVTKNLVRRAMLKAVERAGA